MDDALTQLRAELAGRYEVEQELGRGGMAVVYLAKDVRHERRVAIKVLRQDVTAGAERFLREIRTVAQLHHPHILQLLDSGTAGDHLFYVMPYVEGETVRERLEREGPLPVEEAVRIAREVADGLAFAHTRGIVHRDIKPENIFLSTGHALVADFGIARAAESAAGSTTLTDAGLAVGTPSYMSPEQATADPKVDGRSDQYALGCVLYEMLAGAPPFTGPTSQSIMARHTVDPVPPLKTVRALPAALESAILKALAKMPADRWASAKEFAEQLERTSPSRMGGELTSASTGRARRNAWLSWGATGVVLVTSALLLRTYFGGRDESAPGSVGQVRSVALRDFSFRGETAYDFIAETFADLLTPGLLRVGLSVKDPSLIATRAGRSDDVVEIGRALDVDAVLSGEVQVRGNLLYVSAQLASAVDGALLWQENLNGELEVEGQPRDVFAIVDSLALRVVAALLPELTSEGRAAVPRGVRTTNLKALALREEAGRSPFTRQGTARAVTLLEEAIRLDSLYSDAWAALSYAVQNRDLWLGKPPAERAVAGLTAVQRAIDLDPYNAGALQERGWWRAIYQWDWEGAWRDMRHAVRLNPSSYDVLGNYAGFLAVVSDHDSSLIYTRQAVALDRSNAANWALLGRTFMFAGMRDSAIIGYERALALNDDSLNVHTMLMHLYASAGRSEDAVKSAKRVRELDGELPNGLMLAAFYRRVKDRAGAEQLLKRLTTLGRTQYVTPTSIASTLLALGDRAGALDALEQARRERDLDLHGGLLFWLAPLRGEPRFDALCVEVLKRPCPASAIP